MKNFPDSDLDNYPWIPSIQNFNVYENLDIFIVTNVDENPLVPETNYGMYGLGPSLHTKEDYKGVTKPSIAS